MLKLIDLQNYFKEYTSNFEKKYPILSILMKSYLVVDRNK